MKKYFYLAAVVLTAALSFTACNDDDDNDNIRKYASAEFSIWNNFNDDFVKFCDVTWTITDWDGNTSTIKGAAEEKEYKFKTTKNEGTATIIYTCTTKSGLTPDGQEYWLTAAPSFGYEVLDQYDTPMEDSYWGYVFNKEGWGTSFDDETFVEMCGESFNKTVTYTLTLKNNHITCDKK